MKYEIFGVVPTKVKCGTTKTVDIVAMYRVRVLFLRTESTRHWPTFVISQRPTILLRFKWRKASLCVLDVICCKLFDQREA